MRHNNLFLNYYAQATRHIGDGCFAYLACCQRQNVQINLILFNLIEGTLSSSLIMKLEVKTDQISEIHISPLTGTFSHVLMCGKRHEILKSKGLIKDLSIKCVL